MKKFLTISAGLSALVAAVGFATGSYAAVSQQLRGSDTLEVLTESIISGGTAVAPEALDGQTNFSASACAGVAPLNYIGGGSSNGEQAMLDAVTTAPNPDLIATQVTAPMSRELQAGRTCRAQDPTRAQGYVVALDGLAIVEEDSNTQCASNGVAFNPECIEVQDLNGIAGISNDECPGCESGNTQYCFSNEFDVLRVLFSGMHKNGGATIGNQRCNSDVRHSLAASWDKIHAGACATGECTRLEHAWRRDDLSGTTDTFLSLLGLPAINVTNPAAVKPFCNGTATEELDPVRRPCQTEDITCNANGQAGLVLPIFVPELAEQFEGQAYATEACQNGKFGLAPSKSTDLGGGVIKRDCPERDNFSIAGFCLAPQTSAGSFRCNSSRSNPNVFFANLTDDARIFNKWVRTAAGELAVDKAGRPETFGWHKIRLACQQESSTLNIGCLAGDYDCSWGFAGREADVAFATSKALKVKDVAPSVETVRNLIQTCDVDGECSAPDTCVGGNPATTDRKEGTCGAKYPLARKLYFNTLVGFANVASSSIEGAANEAALTSCFATKTNADFAAVAGGFITLGSNPVCEDFDERQCNTQTFTCDTDADCGGVGPCVGGNIATSAKEGTCDQSCSAVGGCRGGRTCNTATNKCEYATNTVRSCL
jgi:hypothetical protein